MRRAAGLLCLLLTVLAGCAFPWSEQHSAPPAVLIPGQSTHTPPPPGWYRVLDGQRFSDNAGSSGLAVSAAMPGRIVGCALPAQRPRSAPPTLVVSSDGGRAWQARSIPHVPDAQTCLVLVDSQRPDTVLVFPSNSGSGQFVPPFVTTDLGRTWYQLGPMNGQGMALLGQGQGTQLVGGHLIAMLGTPTGANLHLMDVQFSSSGISQVTPIPYPQPNPTPSVPSAAPMAVSVDPADASHIYAAFYTGPAGAAVYATRDAGRSWSRVLSLPVSTFVHLWTPLPNSVDVQSIASVGTPYQFFVSGNGGATWNGIGLHHQGADTIAIGPDGRVITFADGLTFNLDPATGVFSELGQAPFFGDTGQFSQVFHPVVVAGDHPAVVSADQYDTYAMPLTT